MSKVSTCLWFGKDAEAAVRFYVSLVPDSCLKHIQRSPGNWPGGEAGDVIMVTFTLGGQRFQALNGGSPASYGTAASISVECADQTAVDRLWTALIADGGSEIMCGWLRDKWGVPWQIVPETLPRLLPGLPGADHDRVKIRHGCLSKRLSPWDAGDARHAIIGPILEMSDAAQHRLCPKNLKEMARAAPNNLEVDGLLRRNGAIQRAFPAFEIGLEVVDAFAGQPIEADRQDHSVDAPASNSRRRKITFGIAERQPRPLSRNKELRRRLIVLQAARNCL